MAQHQFDAVVIGGGILGLATAREWLARTPDLRLVVLEKETAIAQHQTGRNSGVIHSGVYYKPGSLKAELCVRGGRMLKSFCDKHSIPYQACGKLIIAAGEADLLGLNELIQRGARNGVPGLQMVSEERIVEIEPHARGVAAVYCPGTSIVDFRKVALALATEIEAAGAEIRYGVKVQSVRRPSTLWELETLAGRIVTNWLITCAGLQSDILARMTGGERDPMIVPFRGDYLVLRPERATQVKGLIYPVPDRRFPFLGVHATKRTNGEVWLGPNAVLAFAREGYRFTTMNIGELVGTLTWPGFRSLAARYWRTGIAEFGRDLSKRLFVRAVRRYLPDLQVRDVLRGPSGVRAQAVSADGKLVEDFVFNDEEGVLHVRNAPSPAATACLAIASHILDRFASKGGQCGGTTVGLPGA